MSHPGIAGEGSVSTAIPRSERLRRIAHRAYSTRRRRPTCARPTPPLPYRTSLRNRRLSTRIFTAQHYHSTDASPALPAAHLSAQ